MKLWEVMRLLEEDPSRKFEYQDSRKKWILYADVEGLTGLVFYMLDCWDNNGELMTGTAFGSLHGNLSTSNNWQLVQQPVTWQEAIQAWADCKKVVWEEDMDRRVFDRNKSWPIPKYQNRLLDQDGYAVTVRMISGGKWYVED